MRRLPACSDMLKKNKKKKMMMMMMNIHDIFHWMTESRFKLNANKIEFLKCEQIECMLPAPILAQQNKKLFCQQRLQEMFQLPLIIITFLDRTLLTQCLHSCFSHTCKTLKSIRYLLLCSVELTSVDNSSFTIYCYCW